MIYNYNIKSIRKTAKNLGTCFFCHEDIDDKQINIHDNETNQDYQICINCCIDTCVEEIININQRKAAEASAKGGVLSKIITFITRLIAIVSVRNNGTDGVGGKTGSFDPKLRLAKANDQNVLYVGESLVGITVGKVSTRRRYKREQVGRRLEDKLTKIDHIEESKYTPYKLEPGPQPQDPDKTTDQIGRADVVSGITSTLLLF